MHTITRRLLLGTGVIVAAVLGLAAAGVGLYLYITRPLEDGGRLSDGRVTTVVTDHYGPIGIAAYLFELGAGGMGLVDAGLDPEATAITAALSRMGKARTDVRVIFLTHAHDDHAGGIAAFSGADVYAFAPDVDSIRRRRGSSGVAGATRTIESDGPLEIFGTRIDAYALPGHTRGSAAYVVTGVLFFGDSAQGLRNGAFGANTMLAADAEAASRSVAALAGRMKSRTDIHHMAFGHSGSLDGLQALFDWESSAR